MRIRYCPKCNKAGLKWDDKNGKGYDGLTDKQRYHEHNINIYRINPSTLWKMRYCPRCEEWVEPILSRNYDQHKVR